MSSFTFTFSETKKTEETEETEETGETGETRETRILVAKPTEGSFAKMIINSTIWAVLDLNQWPSACKADALPLS